MKNLVEKNERGDPNIFFCPGLDWVKGGKPGYSSQFCKNLMHGIRKFWGISENFQTWYLKNKVLEFVLFFQE
jgi:hypothetical protein